MIDGLRELESALNHRLTGLRRCVLSLGIANDKFGHGITELDFADASPISIGPGPNEDFLRVRRCTIEDWSLNNAHWTVVSSDSYGDGYRGLVHDIDIYEAEGEDVALVIKFDHAQFSIVLYDTDVLLGRGLESFGETPPALRTIFSVRPQQG